MTGWFHTRYAPVRRSPPRYCYLALPLDLHVLGLPLAFILSQDQTLHCKNCFFTFLTHRISPPASAGDSTHAIPCLNLFKQRSLCYQQVSVTFKADAKIQGIYKLPKFFSFRKDAYLHSTLYFNNKTKKYFLSPSYSTTNNTSFCRFHIKGMTINRTRKKSVIVNKVTTS